MEEVSPLPDHVLELGQSLVGRPIFLLGCARSGTSILGEAIAAHPNVAYLFEVSAIWNTLVPEKNHHRLTADTVTTGVASQIYKALADARRELSGDLLLEKNPKHVIRIPFLDALFPQARFVHIIRDGRDTIASLMFRNRGPNWGHLKIPQWEQLLERYPKESHIRCAHQWNYAVSTARQDAQGLTGKRYLEVRYEALVRAPKAELTRLLQFLELPADSQVNAFVEKIQDETYNSYHAKRQVRHYVEDHARRVGRYRENLTTRQLEDVMKVCGPLLGELGY